MKYFLFIIINSLVILGIVTLLFSQKNYNDHDESLKEKSKSTYKVKTNEQKKEPEKKTIQNKKIADSKVKPKIASQLQQNSNVLGKAFSSANGSGGGSIDSNGGTFSEQIAQDNSQKEQSPQIISYTDPKYPDTAKSKNIEGFIRIVIQISEQGKLDHFNIIESNPAGIFDDSIKEAIQNWTFKPGLSKGKQVSGTITKRITFKLDQL